MSLDELSGVVEQLKAHGEMLFLPAATEDKIVEFEAKHGFNLPSKLKEWLLFSDGGECYLPAGIQLYGVTHKPEIDVNDNDRPDDNYIVIGALSTGDPILCEKSGEHIFIYNHEAGKIEDDEVFSDFFIFLSSLDEVLGIGG
jgi:hypothetical protein